MDKTNYRIVPKVIKKRQFFDDDVGLVIQKKIRGMTYLGYVSDVWVDCSEKDVSQVVLDLLGDK
jgi:hypothetical protein